MKAYGVGMRWVQVLSLLHLGNQTVLIGWGGGGETGFISLPGNIQGIGQSPHEPVMFHRQSVDAVLERGMALHRLKEVQHILNC